MTTEHDIQNAVRVALSQMGHKVFRVNTGTVKTEHGVFSTGVPKGFSDLFVVRKGDGRAVFIEMKKPGGRVRPEQVTFLHTMQEQGALAGIARSVDDAIRIVEGVNEQSNN